VNSGTGGGLVLFIVEFAYTVDVIVVVLGRISQTVRGSPGPRVMHGGAVVCGMVIIVLLRVLVVVEFDPHHVPFGVLAVETMTDPHGLAVETITDGLDCVETRVVGLTGRAPSLVEPTGTLGKSVVVDEESLD
jgi:hypothetical protein